MKKIRVINLYLKGKGCETRSDELKENREGGTNKSEGKSKPIIFILFYFFHSHAFVILTTVASIILFARIIQSASSVILT